MTRRKIIRSIKVKIRLRAKNLYKLNIPKYISDKVIENSLLSEEFDEIVNQQLDIAMAINYPIFHD